MLNGIRGKTEAIAKEKLVVLLGGVVVEKFIAWFEGMGVETLECEGVVGLKVPFYLCGNGMVENVDDREENGNGFLIGKNVCRYESS